MPDAAVEKQSMNANMRKAFGLCAVTMALAGAGFVATSVSTNKSTVTKTTHHVKLIYIGHAPKTVG